MPEDRAYLLEKDREEALRLVARLSPLENQILGGLVDGYSVRSIATILFLAPSEVEQAKANLMQTLSAGSTADVVRIGIYTGARWPH